MKKKTFSILISEIANSVPCSHRLLRQNFCSIQGLWWYFLSKQICYSVTDFFFSYVREEGDYELWLWIVEVTDSRWRSGLISNNFLQVWVEKFTLIWFFVQERHRYMLKNMAVHILHMIKSHSGIWTFPSPPPLHCKGRSFVLDDPSQVISSESHHKVEYLLSTHRFTRSNFSNTPN